MDKPVSASLSDYPQENHDCVKLTYHDSQASGKHHFLLQSATMSIGEFVTLNITAAEAESQ